MKKSHLLLLSALSIHISLHSAAYNPHILSDRTQEEQMRMAREFASQHAHQNAVTQVIKKGSIEDLERFDFSTCRPTAQHMAFAAQKSLAAVRTLHQKGGSVSELHDNLSPAAYALLSFENFAEKATIIAYLCSNGADPNMRLRDNATLLHHASKIGILEIIKILLQFKADLTLQDNQGRTPLHHALMAKKPAAALALIEAQAPLYLKDKEGKTPLHHAAETSQLDLYSALLKRGADPSLDLKLKLPIDYLPAEERDSILEKEKELSIKICNQLKHLMWGDR